MKLPPTTTRAENGAPLTQAQHDRNLEIFRDGINALMALWGVAFNPNGTLKDGTVTTNALIDRLLTAAKLGWHGNFFGETVGANTYVLTINPSTGFDYGDGESTSFVAPIKFDSANTGPSTLNINGAGAKSLRKFGDQELADGDIIAGQIYWIAYDGANIQLLGQLGSGVDRSELTVLQMKVHAVTTSTSTNAVIPDDDTKPQNTEGVEYTTYAFTPLRNDSKLLIEFSSALHLQAGGGDSDAPVTIALFKDSDVDAIAAVGYWIGDDRSVHVKLDHVMDAAGAMTFKIRFGVHDPDETAVMNSLRSTEYNGLMTAVLKITEYMP